MTSSSEPLEPSKSLPEIYFKLNWLKFYLILYIFYITNNYIFSTVDFPDWPTSFQIHIQYF